MPLAGSGFSTNPSQSPAAPFYLVRSWCSGQKPPLFDAMTSSRLVYAYMATPDACSYLRHVRHQRQGNSLFLESPMLISALIKTRNGYNPPYGTSDRAIGISFSLPSVCSGAKPVSESFRISNHFRRQRTNCSVPAPLIRRLTDHFGRRQPQRILGASGANGADDQSNFYDNLLGNSSVN